MTRETFIERAIRQIYGGQPSNDSEITTGLVNQWLQDAIGVAAKQNYKDAIQLDGIGYVNNSFYSTFKGLEVVEDENFLYKITLPQIPVGIGKTEGVARLQFKDANSNISLPYQCVPLSQNEVGIADSMRVIPGKILFYPEGLFLYAKSSLQLWNYTATVTLISGGDSTDLTSELNVPSDYFPVMVEYIKAQLIFEKSQPQDTQNDGKDKA